jgi:hypothetical protein
MFERADEFLLLGYAADQQRHRQTRADPDSLGGLNEFRPPVMCFADNRAHRRALPRGFQARPPARRVLLEIEFQRLLMGGGRGTGIRPRQHGDADGVRIRDRGDCGLGDPRHYIVQGLFGGEEISKSLDRGRGSYQPGQWCQQINTHDSCPSKHAITAATGTL